MKTFEMFPEVHVVFPRHSVAASSRSGHSKSTAEPLSLRVAEGWPDLESLRPVWNQWSQGLETDLDYYLHNLHNDATILQPYVITVLEHGVPQAMLVGVIRERRVSTVISSVNIHGPKVKALEVLHGGRMGAQSAAIDQRFAQHLRHALRAGEIDLLCFRRLALQSNLFRALQRAPGLLLRERVPHVFSYSVVPLTATAGKRARALSGKNRREARRKARLLERTFPGQARFQCFSSPGELDSGLRDANAVDLFTWQHSLGCGLLDAPQAREQLAFCARRGWLRIYVMYVAESPVAFLAGQHYRQTFYCQHAGYCPEFARYSVGSLLTAWALETLAAAGVATVDLGEGGQEHNRRLGCEFRRDATVHLYSSTPRGLCAGAFFAATQAVRAVGRKAREGLGNNWADRAWARFWLARRKAAQVAASTGTTQPHPAA